MNLDLFTRPVSVKPLLFKALKMNCLCVKKAENPRCFVGMPYTLVGVATRKTT